MEAKTETSLTGSRLPGRGRRERWRKRRREDTAGPLDAELPGIAREYLSAFTLLLSPHPVFSFFLPYVSSSFSSFFSFISSYSRICPRRARRARALATIFILYHSNMRSGIVSRKFVRERLLCRTTTSVPNSFPR